MASGSEGSSFLFLPFRFDLTTICLWPEDRLVPPQPKSRTFPRYLIERREQGVSTANFSPFLLNSLFLRSVQRASYFVS